MNHEGESVSQQKLEKQRLPYHAPRVMSFCLVESLMQGGLAGSRVVL